MPPNRHNQIVEGHLQEIDFYQSVLVNTLIERWHSETHTFYFSVGECAVILEEVAIILDLPTNSLPVTGPTLNNYEALEAECLH
ncbi:hypothetical protein AHAS_Ahas19G0143300 [Arachis hypogaea]